VPAGAAVAVEATPATEGPALEDPVAHRLFRGRGVRGRSTRRQLSCTWRRLWKPLLVLGTYLVKPMIKVPFRGRGRTSIALARRQRSCERGRCGW
jgi:hypothetical protein